MFTCEYIRTFRASTDCKKVLHELSFFDEIQGCVGVSTMVGNTKKTTMQFGIFVFVAVEESNRRGN